MQLFEMESHPGAGDGVLHTLTNDFSAGFSSRVHNVLSHHHQPMASWVGQSPGLGTVQYSLPSWHDQDTLDKGNNDFHQITKS